MNLKTPDTQAAQSSLGSARSPLTDAELNAIVGGRKVTVTVTTTMIDPVVIKL